MADDGNNAFVNKYIQVLKNKYDQQSSDLINLEAQIIMLKESIDVLSQENEYLKNLIEEQKSVKTSTTKSKNTEV
jgi:hypothetical protein